jgi:hypothetical protein
MLLVSLIERERERERERLNRPVQFYLKDWFST